MSSIFTSSHHEYCAVLKLKCATVLQLYLQSYNNYYCKFEMGARVAHHAAGAEGQVERVLPLRGARGDGGACSRRGEKAGGFITKIQYRSRAVLQWASMFS